jgi:hypothetical protein
MAFYEKSKINGFQLKKKNFCRYAIIKIKNLLRVFLYETNDQLYFQSSSIVKIHTILPKKNIYVKSRK